MQPDLVEGARHVQALGDRLEGAGPFGLLAHGRDDEGDDVAAAQRHPNDVADRQFEIAGIVGKRKVEAR